MKTLTTEDITHIAHLARLSLTEAEKQQYASELSVVLEYIGMLNEVDTSAVPETCQVTGLQNVAREDVAIDTPQDEKDRLLSSFPDAVGNLLKVQAVFDDNEE